MKAVCGRSVMRPATRPHGTARIAPARRGSWRPTNTPVKRRASTPAVDTRLLNAPACARAGDHRRSVGAAHCSRSGTSSSCRQSEDSNASGGGRAERAAGISVGRPRRPRIRRTTRGSSMRDQLETVSAAGTRQHVEAKAPLHQLRPEPIRAQPDRRRLRRCPVPGGACRRVLRSLGHRQTRSPRRIQQVDARPRRERRQPLEQLQRIEHEVRRAIRPPVPQIQDDLPRRRQVQPSCAIGGRSA
jgi:hypothetical protein